ncbi:ATP-binding cassette domain-containing protein [Clostridium mediterraneense]|uniref:ABC transporter ATP-binding protein n=1 Tax=Clostridium mediterraneense TaxID=1805472 RepID=UPI00082ACCE8|nr:ATP-binding cassette domain-containing protein [Clostridium mediterraneense]
MVLEVKGLTKKFKNFTAVDGISFSVNEGEILGLLGENGAGKTTALRMIATMLQPSAGTAIVNGHDVNKDPAGVRGSIGILFGGDVGIYDRLTARENIMYFAQLGGLSKKQANKNIEKLIKDFEMDSYIDRVAGKFSRGMKQKVSIARSIVHDPKVMLFDEPCTGLDVSATRSVQRFILNCKKDNKAVILSSHSMYEVEKLCDRVAIIHKGKIVEVGTIPELKAKYQNDDLEEIFIHLIGGESNE